MTVSDMLLDESGSNFAIVAATSLLLDVTRGSSEAYEGIENEFVSIDEAESMVGKFVLMMSIIISLFFATPLPIIIVTQL